MTRGELRRPNCAMDIEDCRRLLQQEVTGRLATVGPDGYPYVVPVHYVYHFEPSQLGLLYFHCALGGHKVDNIEYSSRVCFQVDGGYQIVEKNAPCSYSTRYRSVVVFGDAIRVCDLAEVTSALTALVKVLAPGRVNWELNAESQILTRTCVFRINVEMMTGKASQE